MKTLDSTNSIKVQIAKKDHLHLVPEIVGLIEVAAQKRGTGIAKRSPEYLEAKIRAGKAVIAVAGQALAGFCYIETWEHGNYTANSGLIVHPDYQGRGLGKEIKAKAFELAREMYPDAKVFGITTSLAVMKINSSLGYEPVTFSELTKDKAFWDGCSGCVNYDILNRTQRQHCLCTGMLYDPVRKKGKTRKTAKERWQRFVNFLNQYKPASRNDRYARMRQLVKNRQEQQAERSRRQ